MKIILKMLSGNKVSQNKLYNWYNNLSLEQKDSVISVDDLAEAEEGEDNYTNKQDSVKNLNSSVKMNIRKRQKTMPEYLASELTSQNPSYAVWGRVLPEVTLYPNAPLYAQLETWYPGNPKLLIGHSVITTPRGETITASMKDKDYDLFTNNCSDVTRLVLNTALGLNINPNLFTTPGDVRDAVRNINGTQEVGRLGYIISRIPVTLEQARNLEYLAYLRKAKLYSYPNIESEQKYVSGLHGSIPHNPYMKFMTAKNK